MIFLKTSLLIIFLGLLWWYVKSFITKITDSDIVQNGGSLVISLLIMILPFTIYTYWNETNQNNYENELIERTKYKLLRSHDLDTFLGLGAKRTQYDIEIAANTADDEIKVILEQAVKELAENREVDALSVRLYLEDTNLPYAIADWAPYGEWSEAEKGKNKSIFKTSIKIYPENRAKETSKVEKLGLSLEKRKMIYRELSRSQDITRQIATEKYPNDIMKHYDYMTELDKLYKKEICEKYNLTDMQRSSIFLEGIENNWPD